MKVLNLYSGIGGNRKLWEDVDVTAVEWDQQTAKVYQDYFPNDTVIVGDAHQYLLDHFKEFDFIWSSPPCPTHSRARFWGYSQDRPVYPDMSLYQEIIFLQNHCECKWVVENVIPYYDPLIPAKEIDRHLFWSNFVIPHYPKTKYLGNHLPQLEAEYGFKVSGPKRKKILRNCVNPKVGLHIMNHARGIVIKSKSEQSTLFE